MRPRGALVLLGLVLLGCCSASSPASGAPRSVAPVACVAPASWSTSRLAEQTLAVPVEESDVAAVSSEVRGGAGGIVLFGASAPPDLPAQLALLRRAAGQVAPFVMVDEEGGAVQRLANLVGNLPSARQLGATLSPGAIRVLARGLGERLRAVGVTMDLAPVLDVDGGAGPNASDADGTRSFSAVPAVAAADGVAFAEGLRAGGVIPVVKHFPGLGGATGNTDVVVASTRPWSVLETTGLAPFAAAIHAGVPAVMVAVASVPGLTSLPAALSGGVVEGELRTKLGFHGLVLTDSLSAVSVSGRGYGLPEAAVLALRAGADVVLFNAPSSTTAQVTASIVDAVTGAVTAGRLSRSRLVAAAGDVLFAKSVALCGR
jgi:beta-N-acetylhexosaminidase